MISSSTYISHFLVLYELVVHGCTMGTGNDNTRGRVRLANANGTGSGIVFKKDSDDESEHGGGGGNAVNVEELIRASDDSDGGEAIGIDW